MTPREQAEAAEMIVEYVHAHLQRPALQQVAVDSAMAAATRGSRFVLGYDEDEPRAPYALRVAQGALDHWREVAS